MAQFLRSFLDNHPYALDFSWVRSSQGKTTVARALWNISFDKAAKEWQESKKVSDSTSVDNPATDVQPQTIETPKSIMETLRRKPYFVAYRVAERTSAALNQINTLRSTVKKARSALPDPSDLFHSFDELQRALGILSSGRHDLYAKDNSVLAAAEHVLSNLMTFEQTYDNYLAYLGGQNDENLHIFYDESNLAGIRKAVRALDIYESDEENESGNGDLHDFNQELQENSTWRSLTANQQEAILVKARENEDIAGGMYKATIMLLEALEKRKDVIDLQTFSRPVKFASSGRDRLHYSPLFNRFVKSVFGTHRSFEQTPQSPK